MKSNAKETGANTGTKSVRNQIPTVMANSMMPLRRAMRAPRKASFINCAQLKGKVRPVMISSVRSLA